MITLLIAATCAGLTGVGLALSNDPIYNYERESESKR